MTNILDNNDTDLIVALYRESPKIPGRYDRVVWYKSEQRFIYGDRDEYMVYHGDESEPYLDIDIETQELNRHAYNIGSTQCGSSFYDDKGKLYEIINNSSYPKLIFDANDLE